MYTITTNLRPTPEQIELLKLSIRAVKWITEWTVDRRVTVDEPFTEVARHITKLKKEARHRWLAITDSQTLWLAANEVERQMKQRIPDEQILCGPYFIRVKQTMATPSVGTLVIGKLGEHACDMATTVPDQDRIKRITVGYINGQWRATLYVKRGQPSVDPVALFKRHIETMPKREALLLVKEIFTARQRRV